jgi:hypothetical protein
MVEEIQRQRTVFPDRRYEPQAIFSTDPETYGEGWAEYPDNYGTNFPTREMADRFDYGYGQHRPQYNEPFYNPEVLERQIGLDQFPGAASNIARIHNEYAQTGNQWASSPQEVRDITGWLNAIKSNPELIDPMYQGLYDFTGPQESVDMWKSKREQIEEARAEGIYGDYIAGMMEDYGRDNPYLQELGGITTTIDPYGKTTEEYTDLGYDVRLPNEVSGAYGANLDPNLALPPSNIGYDRGGPMGVPSNIGYDRAGGTGVPSNIGYDRAGPRGPAYPPNIGFDRAGADPALPPSDLGFARAGAEPALPPSNIGFARAGADPALPPSDIGYDRAGRGERWWDKIPSWLWPLLGGGASPGAKGIGTLLGNR